MAACVRALGFEKYAQRVADEGYDLRSLVRATPEVPYNTRILTLLSSSAQEFVLISVRPASHRSLDVIPDSRIIDVNIQNVLKQLRVNLRVDNVQHSSFCGHK